MATHHSSFIRPIAVIASIFILFPAFAGTGIVPKPQSVEEYEGKFPIYELTVAAKNKSLESDVDKLLMLSEQIGKTSGLTVSRAAKKAKAIVLLSIDDKLAYDEYVIDSRSGRFLISGGSHYGLWLSMQTLRQILCQGERVGSELLLPRMLIKDKPAYKYRGAHLDCVRHFFQVEEVKRYIDIMALHKLNYFHWHLTDNEGWRIQIDKYPELTATGSVRRKSVVGHHYHSNEFDHEPYGGYYTKEQISEIIKYAENAGITVVPEIEMPGHSLAALASYPYLGCRNGGYHVGYGTGGTSDIFCAGRESTFEFLFGVLDEVCEMFPGPYIHIGGDEVLMERWMKCPDCQDAMKRNKLESAKELQNYFMSRIARYVQSKGKRAIGWDEILHDGISEDVVIMSWRGREGGVAAAGMGNDVIMSPSSHCYFDYPQNPDGSDALNMIPDDYRHLTSLEKVFSFDPEDGLTDVEKRHLMGLQCNVWTEYAPSFNQVQKLALPRMAALSERAWSGERTSYVNFLDRLCNGLKPVYDACGYNYCTTELDRTRTLKSPDGKLEMTFTLAESGSMQYSLRRRSVDVVLPSSLGFIIHADTHVSKPVIGSDGSIHKIDNLPLVDFYRDFVIESTDTSSLDQTWETVWGEESRIRNHYNELAVSLRHLPTGRRIVLRFRLFNDGLGFRYEFRPLDRQRDYILVADELTEFAMAGDHKAWWIPGDYETQEYEYAESRLSEVPLLMESRLLKNKFHAPFNLCAVQTSLQMKTDDGLYINIHEAALKDYSCMHLLINPETHVLKAALTPSAAGDMCYLQAPCTTPWRTVQVASDGAAQLSSRMILNLNEPCAFEDVSWIHPTKYMGVWWEMISGKGQWSYFNAANATNISTFDYKSAKPHGLHSANTENVRRYIDFAAENGFDELLVEGWNIGWEDWDGDMKDEVFDFVTPAPDFDIAGLNEYAHSKGIKLMMHHETSTAVRNYERHLEAAYQNMEKYGYDAVKSGYVNTPFPRGEHRFGQVMNNHYNYAVVQAAKHHIMVNAHEAVRPTGLCRTYPNMVGNESAMGTEYQAFGGISAGHVTILPFTRLNGGPMDYTPGIFVMDMTQLCPTNDSKVKATICNQLALYLTMYSPLQMAADLPEHYARFADAFQFIKDVPVDWSESRYLEAEPGDYILVARKDRKSENWFVGAVTDENRREMSVPLTFLDEGAQYVARIYADAPDAHYLTNPQAYVISEREVTSKDILTAVLAPGGGYAVSIFKK